MDQKTIRVFYCAYPMVDMLMNFGDLLTMPVLEHYKPDGIKLVASKEKECRMVAVGSILHSYPVRRKIVWGSGALDESMVRGFSLDKHWIYALRGKKTLESIGLKEASTPHNGKIALGDPGLLAKETFGGTVDRNGKIGIIPHYFDAGRPELDRFRDHPQYKMIDVQRSPEEVIRDISACRAVASSSLHGLIVSDSFGIPNRWLKISLDQDFKFHDYFSSIGRDGMAAEPISAEDVKESVFAPIPYTAGIERSKRELQESLQRLFDDVLSGRLPFETHDASMDLCQIPKTLFIECCIFFERNRFLRKLKSMVRHSAHR